MFYFSGLGQHNGHGESSVSIGKVFKLCQENAAADNSSSPPRDWFSRKRSQPRGCPTGQTCRGRHRKAGGGIWGRRRGRVSRKRQPRREQGLRDAEAQEGERGAPQGGRDTEKIPGLFEASPSVRFESVRTGGHGMSVKKACGALGASGGGCYAFPNRPKSSSR